MDDGNRTSTNLLGKKHLSIPDNRRARMNRVSTKIPNSSHWEKLGSDKKYIDASLTILSLATFCLRAMYIGFQEVYPQGRLPFFSSISAATLKSNLQGVSETGMKASTVKPIGKGRASLHSIWNSQQAKRSTRRSRPFSHHIANWALNTKMY